MHRTKFLIIALLLVVASCKTESGSPQVNARWAAGPDIGNLDLLGVDFIDDRLGWAVGDIEPGGSTSGAVHHTSDGGRTWAKVASTSEIFEAVHFVSPTRGWIAGYGGRIQRTDDGGRTWTGQRVEREGEVLNAIFFLDNQRGWVVGGNGVIFRTANGGETWEVLPTGRLEDLWDVKFASGERGWIVGEEGLILATADGGRSWDVQSSGTQNALFGLAVTPQGPVVAVGDKGTILRSEDGKTWAPVDSKTGAALNAVAAAGKDVFWAVGAKGATAGSSDGGRTWNSTSPVSRRDLISIDLTSPSHGAAVGSRGSIQRLEP
ncbi:MAG TPA: YCF48-related protein [Blastocatellia bacterium]|nr:YCF48-related protein [Blastocatellia bacterium]